MLRSIGLLLLAFLIQGTVAGNLAVRSIRPDFILLALVYVGLSQGSIAGMMLGWTVGLLQDFYRPLDPVSVGAVTNLGLNALCKTIIGYLTGCGKEGLYKENLPNLIGVLFFAVLFHDTIYFFIDTRYDFGSMATMLWRHGLATGAYTALVGALLALAVAYRRGRFYGRRLFP